MEVPMYQSWLIRDWCDDDLDRGGVIDDPWLDDVVEVVEDEEDKTEVVWCGVVTEAVEEDVDMETIGDVDVSRTMPAAVEAETDAVRVVDAVA